MLSGVYDELVINKVSAVMHGLEIAAAWSCCNELADLSQRAGECAESARWGTHLDGVASPAHSHRVAPIYDAFCLQPYVDRRSTSERDYALLVTSISS